MDNRCLNIEWKKNHNHKMQRHQKKRPTTATSKNYKYASLIGIVLNAVEASLVLGKKNASVEIALNSDIEVLTASHSLDRKLTVFEMVVNKFGILWATILQPFHLTLDTPNDRLIRRGVFFYIYWLLEPFQTHHSIKVWLELWWSVPMNLLEMLTF